MQMVSAEIIQWNVIFLTKRTFFSIEVTPFLHLSQSLDFINIEKGQTHRNSTESRLKLKRMIHLIEFHSDFEAVE